MKRTTTTFSQASTLTLPSAVPLPTTSPPGASQQLDGSVTARGRSWDARLGELEAGSVSAEGRYLGLSERLGGVEAMAAAGLESLLVRRGRVYVAGWYFSDLCLKFI